MALLKFAPPTLNIPGDTYSQNYMNQLVRILNVYFNQLGSTTPIQADYFLARTGSGATGYFKGRGDQLIMPYALLMSSLDQASAGITSENLIEFDNPIFTNNISVQGVNNTEIHFEYPGQYLVSFSLQVTNRSNNVAEFEVWAKDAGVNYPLSNTRFDIPARKSSTVWSHIAPAVTGIFTVADPAVDYIELAWWSDNIDVFLEHYAAGTAPARPEIPSVICTVSFVSAIP